MVKNKPYAEQSIRKGLSDIGGARPNLTQPPQIYLGGNLTKSECAHVLRKSKA